MHSLNIKCIPITYPSSQWAQWKGTFTVEFLFCPGWEQNSRPQAYNAGVLLSSLIAGLKRKKNSWLIFKSGLPLVLCKGCYSAPLNKEKIALFGIYLFYWRILRDTCISWRVIFFFLSPNRLIMVQIPTFELITDRKIIAKTTTTDKKKVDNEKLAINSCNFSEVPVVAENAHSQGFSKFNSK